MSPELDEYEVAVILPCYNEAEAIARVVAEFSRALPKASVYVFDNNSTDDTAVVAAAAGAIVRREPLRGKGNVVRRAFAEVEADIYVLSDGDGSYDASYVPEMLELLHRERLEMVVGVRKQEDRRAWRPGHRLGNGLFNLVLRNVLNSPSTDVFSGYRVFSRTFVKSFPALAPGFETEMEMTLHALNLKLPVGELDTRYGPRAPGTVSKLNTFRDDARILLYMAGLTCQYRPMLVFGSIGMFLMLASLTVGIPVVIEYFRTGLVPRFPTAFAAANIMVIAFVCFIVGLILNGISYSSREAKRIAYLGISRYRASSR